MSLFEGTPQKATSYVSKTDEYPKWMQDAIYNQVQIATNIANRPYQSYDMPTVAELSPLQQQAYQQVQKNVGAWKGEMDFASQGMQGFGSKGTAADLAKQQAQYLREGDVATNLNAANQLFGQAAGIDVTGAAQPYLSQSEQATQRAATGSALSAASPFLQAAGGSAASNVGAYMSPYQQNVLDVIARQGARNLTENILPGVSDAFVRAGQFGSSRMGEMGARAMRDTQEAILNAQAQSAQQGYGQAMQAAQTDLSRQAQLAGTAGSISGADLSRVLQAAGQYQNIGQTAGQLSAQEMQNLANIAQARAGAGQAQQQFGLNAAQASQAAQAADYQRQMAALTNVANMAQQAQSLRAADVAALESAGIAQTNQMQRQLDAAKAQFDAERNYPQQQADFLSTQIRGLAPITPQTSTQSGQTTGATYSPSPLSQIASGVFAGRALAGGGS